jgi:hypothetical protein
VAVNPNKITRVNRHPFDRVGLQGPQRHRAHLLPVKNFRRMATRYDKLARNFLAGLCLVVAIRYWIN